MIEKVKYIDGTEHEVQIYKLSGRKALLLAEEYLPMQGFKQYKDGTVEMSGNMRFFALKNACLETIKDLDLDQLDAEEITRLYETYFAGAIAAAMGQGGNPN